MDEKKFLNEDGLTHLIGKIKNYDAASLAIAKGYVDEKASSIESTISIVQDELDAKIATPFVAEVGQTIVAKEVDENGMPIEWEAVDLGKITIDEDGDAWFGSAEEIYKIPEGLPDYTAEDEGKILSVVDGSAAWSENKGGSGSSGGGGIVVSETEPTDESVIFWVQI